MLGPRAKRAMGCTLWHGVVYVSPSLLEVLVFDVITGQIVHSLMGGHIMGVNIDTCRSIFFTCYGRDLQIILYLKGSAFRHKMTIEIPLDIGWMARPELVVTHGSVINAWAY